jgi:hypothetical protein
MTPRLINTRRRMRRKGIKSYRVADSPLDANILFFLLTIAYVIHFAVSKLNLNLKCHQRSRD